MSFRLPVIVLVGTATAAMFGPSFGFIVRSSGGGAASRRLLSAVASARRARPPPTPMSTRLFRRDDRTTMMSTSVGSEVSANRPATAPPSPPPDGGDSGSVRRTAALVLSMAVQRVLPGALRTSFHTPASSADGGFYLDFWHGDGGDGSADGDDKHVLLRERLKREMDDIIARAEPIVCERVTREEARRRVPAHGGRLPDGEDDGAMVSLCTVGGDWWDLCDDVDGGSADGAVARFLDDTGRLDPGAVALTSICRPEAVDGDSDTGPGVVQRIAVTAWDTKADLLSYKKRVGEAHQVAQSFGQLVNWGSGSLDELEYLCSCCSPTDGGGFLSGGPGPKSPRGPLNQKTRLTKESGPKIDTVDKPSTRLASPFVPSKNPGWLRERETIYDTIQSRRDAELALKPHDPIEVTLPDGTVLGRGGSGEHDLLSWQSSPLDVARCISDGLANVAIVARVWHHNRFGPDEMTLAGDGNDYDFGKGDEEGADDGARPGELWDLTRPLEGDCKIQILTFDGGDEAAKAVFWHSSAHLLGQSLEHNYGALLTIGPPIVGGFYYDAYIGDESLSETQFAEIEEEVRLSVKRKEKFERLVVTKDEALELFQYSPFKTALIAAKVPDNSRTTVYRNGDLIDLCVGPHVPHTGKIKAFTTLRSSASQWLGDVKSDQLQRVYGVSFPSKKMLKVHMANLEKAKERDHRRLGVQQKLFMFHKLSPGSAFFLPHGTIIFNTLCEFIRKQYRARDYSEVVSPNIYNLKLWEQSGHALHYKEDMFTFDVEGEEWGMKPMNCPGHCLLFASTARSYRELPMRIADFGVLHRNEASGALGGLTRVRRFQQDDAHIFCEEDQIEAEVIGCLDFMKFVYDVFGMTYKLELSTRPAKALGEKELWDKAESALASAMDDFAGKGNWKENPGDGAFYGPKIDIKVMDAMDRIHQCATIQLDFQLPLRFDLRYRKKGGATAADGADAGGIIEVESDSPSVSDGADDPDDPDSSPELPSDFARPVMVHRAMLGSVERMFAVLLEHYGGKWPFWLSPRQALVVPVGQNFAPYAEDVRSRLRAAGFHVDIDDSTNTLKKKIREGQLAQYNYILVVGEREQENDSVAVRNRMNEQEGDKKIEDVMVEFQNLCDTYQ